MTRDLVLVRDEQRDHPDGRAQEGRLYVDMPQKDGSLKPSYLGATDERLAVIIAPGVYEIAYHSSEKHPRSVMLLVPGRKFILIHSGGRPAHSDGCVLLGASDLEGATISGGKPLCDWLADQVFGDRAWKEGDIIPGWRIKVLEAAGDPLDGKLV